MESAKRVILFTTVKQVHEVLVKLRALPFLTELFKQDVM